MIFMFIATSLFSQGYSEEWEYGSEVTVTAIPNEGFEFVNWTEDGEVVSEDIEYTFIVTGDRDLVANFQRKVYIITLSADPEDGGEVFGSGIYPDGADATLEAKPYDNWRFKAWHDQITGEVFTDNPMEVKVERNYHFKAGFVADTLFRRLIPYIVAIIVIALMIRGALKHQKKQG